VDNIPKAVQGNVEQVLSQKDERDQKSELCVDLELNQVLDRNVGDLSGGELQRFAIAVVAMQSAEIYMFDEPSSYLDVRQRLKAAQVIRSLLRPNRYRKNIFYFVLYASFLSEEIEKRIRGARFQNCTCIWLRQILASESSRFGQSVN
jgi:ATP-binding cassette, sub-family E, member 1